MMRLARVILTVVIASGGWVEASAQSLDRQDIGHLGQPRRVEVRREWEKLSAGELLCVDERLRRARRSVNALIDSGISPGDDRVAGIVSDCRAVAGRDADSANRAQATAGDKPAFSVAGMQLGSNVAVGSPAYRDYTCAPLKQYAGFTLCQRQTAERSRRRRSLETVSFLHATDGAAVYINQQLDPVAMDENDAEDEIDRLSETLGKATLLPVQDGRGVPSGLIASWGAVSLQPLEAARTAELAAGTDDKPGILVDTIGSPQRSAQLGLPVYRLGGGAGYVWTASWNGRGRGTLRMLAVDASRLPDAPAEARPPADAAAIVAPTAPVAVAAASPSPPPEAPKPAVAAQPAPVAPPAAATAPPAPAPPADVRVVGPPIALQPAAPASAPATTPTTATAPASGHGLNVFLIALIVLAIGTVGYLFRKSWAVRRPIDSRDAPADVIASPAPATVPDVSLAPATPAPKSAEPKSAEPKSAAPKPEKMDLATLIPAESPASIAVPPASSRTG